MTLRHFTHTRVYSHIYQQAGYYIHNSFGEGPHVPYPHAQSPVCGRFLFTSPESLGGKKSETSVVPEIQKLISMVQQAAEERDMLLGSVEDLVTVLKERAK